MSAFLKTLIDGLPQLADFVKSVGLPATVVLWVLWERYQHGRDDLKWKQQIAENLGRLHEALKVDEEDN